VLQAQWPKGPTYHARSKVSLLTSVVNQTRLHAW